MGGDGLRRSEQRSLAGVWGRRGSHRYKYSRWTASCSHVNMPPIPTHVTSTFTSPGVASSHTLQLVLGQTSPSKYDKRQTGETPAVTLSPTLIMRQSSHRFMTAASTVTFRALSTCLCATVGNHSYSITTTILTQDCSILLLAAASTMALNGEDTTCGLKELPSCWLGKAYREVLLHRRKGGWWFQHLQQRT